MRRSQRFKYEGIELSVSTLADQVGAGVFAVMPLYRLIEAHVLTAERLHGDDTTVPILAKGKTIWTYVRDDRPFGGRAPPAALYYASRDRRGEHSVELHWHPPGRRLFRVRRPLSRGAQAGTDHTRSFLGGYSSNSPTSRGMPNWISVGPQRGSNGDKLRDKPSPERQEPGARPYSGALPRPAQLQ
jgi:hypothetical protein